MKTRLIFLLPLLWLLIGCEDSEPESKQDSTDPPLIEYHYVFRISKQPKITRNIQA